MDVVGIDVSTKSCSSSHLNEEGGIKQCLEFANDRAGWAILEDSLTPDAVVVMEASTPAYPIHDHFRRKGYKVVMANPRKLRAITTSKSKTDEKDSLILAQLYRLGYLPEAYVPPPEMLRTRDLLRSSVSVGQEMTRTKNRIHALLTRGGVRPDCRKPDYLFKVKKNVAWLRSLRFGDHRDAVLQALLVQLDALAEQQNILRAEMARTAMQSSEADILMSIKGVDCILALIIISEIGDIRRFPTADALCAYAGIVPSVYQSGDTVVHGKITKRGPGTLRWAVELAAKVAIKHDNPLREKYRRLVRRKKKASVATTAVAHKMLRVIHAMLTKGERCVWEDRHLTDLKIMKMRRTARRIGDRKVPAG